MAEFTSSDRKDHSKSLEHHMQSGHYVLIRQSVDILQIKMTDFFQGANSNELLT